KPSYATLAQWVKDSWEEVDFQLIVKAFKYYGISVKMNKTENDQVFDYKSLNENPTDKNDENFEVINSSDIEGKNYEEVK
ncbi:24139_t:CDS:1, partial [Racocetra persica]